MFSARSLRIRTILQSSMSWRMSIFRCRLKIANTNLLELQFNYVADANTRAIKRNINKIMMMLLHDKLLFEYLFSLHLPL